MKTVPYCHIPFSYKNTQLVITLINHLENQNRWNNWFPITELFEYFFFDYYHHERKVAFASTKMHSPLEPDRILQEITLVEFLILLS